MGETVPQAAEGAGPRDEPTWTGGDSIVGITAPVVRNAWPLTSALPPLAPFASAPSIARGHVGTTLTSWRLEHLGDDARMVASELVTNAYRACLNRQGNPRWINGNQMPVVEFTLFSDGLVLLVEVFDQGAGEPVLRPEEDDAESGRGLHMVAKLARRWGWNEAPGGKVVWAEIAPG